VPAGSIVGLDPATPPQLAKGDAVNVIVSDGPAPRTVPAIAANSTFEQAVAAVTAVQLVPARKDEFSDTVAEGQVIGTEPPAGTAVARDSTVTIIVSKGLPTIPDVKGQSLQDAAAQLASRGLLGLRCAGKSRPHRHGHEPARRHARQVGHSGGGSSPRASYQPLSPTTTLHCGGFAATSLF